MVPRAPSSVSDEDRTGQINARHIEIVVVEKFMPHAHSRLSVLVIQGGYVDAHGNVQLAQDGCYPLFEVGEALGLASPAFHVFLEADLLLIGEYDNLVTAKISTARLSELRGTHPSEFNCFTLDGTEACHHFQSAGPLGNVLPEAVETSVESYRVSAGRPSHQRCPTRSNAAIRLFSVFLL